jgi:HEAT repeats
MWQELLYFLYPTVVVGSLLWSVVQPLRRQRRRRWARALGLCGLQAEETILSAAVGLGLKVQSGPLEARIEASRRRNSDVRITVLVPAPSNLSSVKICPEMDKPLWGHEIEVGDESFDRAFFVTGPVQLLRALLTVEARRLMERAHAKGRLEIVHGEVWAEIPDQQIRSLAPLLFKLGRRLANPLDIPRRLAQNAARDPEARVRLQNLLLLIGELPEHPWTAKALRKALADSSDTVRLHAAKELGAEGHEVLLAIAESLEEDALSAQAISILGEGLQLKPARVLLDLALEKRCLQTACACLERLGHRALGTTGNVDAVPLLLRALESDRRDLCVAAATALGHVGTAAVVLPLEEAAERSAPYPELRRAARQAIAEIQSRLSDASPGQLSLAATETGLLSLAQAETGQLSLPPPTPDS